MQFIFALPVLVFGMSFAYGWACWFIPYRQRGWMILMLTAFGISLGWLTVLMFWVAWIWPGRLGLIPILAGCGVLGSAGLWLKRKDLKPASLPGGTFRTLYHGGTARAVLVVIAILACTGILFNSIYWPFAGEDALAVYAPIAKQIFQTGSLPTGLPFYDAYPALVQLAYAYTHWAYGGINEYLARLVPALMAIGSMAAAGTLGREVRSLRVGIFATASVALTPFFCRWASSGYVDVPGSFYFGLSTLFAWRWWHDGGNKNAILSGMAAGFAMWTKNDALTLLASLGILIGLRLWALWRKTAEGWMANIQWRQIALFAAAVIVIAGPWYVRNMMVFHFITPTLSGTPWANAAEHTLGKLLIMTWAWQDFAVTGLFFTAAILFASVQFIRRTGYPSRAAWGILLIMVIPFYGAWWWLANYDVRFLLMIVPLLAVMAGLMLDDLLAFLAAHLSPISTTWARWLAIVCILALAPLSLRKTVEYKGTILRHPFLDDAEKHRIVLGGIYDLAMAIDRLPAGSRIVGVPAMALYHIDLTRFSSLSQQKISTPPGTLIDSYDYAAYHFVSDQKPDWLPDYQPILQTEDGYFLYAVRGAGASTP